ncbi:MAG: sugar phosphate isomerase/epimerase [Caldilineaceae bacterium]|nr:sugar phosphate isomerase/epimerase [Caldilineaceae bacterium]
MILGYNTNGFAHHSLEQAIEVIASIGYRAVAITIDHGALNPLDNRNAHQLSAVAALLKRHQMTPVIETGCRYLLDPRHKHEPTLVSPSEDKRTQRIALYRYAIDVAKQLEASCVSLWSGVVHDDADDPTALRRLTTALQEVLDYAQQRGVTIGFEPEPGMLIGALSAYDQLQEALDHPDNLRLTLDVGHLHCQQETPIPSYIKRYADEIVNIHIEDMRVGIHEHLMFGEGEIDFPPIIAALSETAYNGPLTVELSRHSHMAPEAARRAFDFLSRLRRNEE